MAGESREISAKYELSDSQNYDYAVSGISEYLTPIRWNRYGDQSVTWISRIGPNRLIIRSQAGMPFSLDAFDSSIVSLVHALECRPASGYEG